MIGRPGRAQDSDDGRRGSDGHAVGAGRNRQSGLRRPYHRRPRAVGAVHLDPGAPVQATTSKSSSRLSTSETTASRTRVSRGISVKSAPFCAGHRPVGNGTAVDIDGRRISGPPGVVGDPGCRRRRRRRCGRRQRRAPATAPRPGQLDLKLGHQHPGPDQGDTVAIAPAAPESPSTPGPAATSSARATVGGRVRDRLAVLCGHLWGRPWCSFGRLPVLMQLLAKDHRLTHMFAFRAERRVLVTV